MIHLPLATFLKGFLPPKIWSGLDNDTKESWRLHTQRCQASLTTLSIASMVVGIAVRSQFLLCLGIGARNCVLIITWLNKKSWIGECYTPIVLEMRGPNVKIGRNSTQQQRDQTGHALVLGRYYSMLKVSTITIILS